MQRAAAGAQRSALNAQASNRVEPRPRRGAHPLLAGIALLWTANAAATDLERTLLACGACHDTGAGGAPKTGRSDDWAPRLRRGMPALVASVKSGVPGSMMPGGLCRDCSDAEIEQVVRRLSQGRSEQP